MHIEGFFPTMKEANDAISKLKSLGYTHAVLDMNDHYIENRNTDINRAGNAEAPSLTGLVFQSGPAAIDENLGPLLAASPMASGFGRFDEVANINCKVIVKADNESEAEVQAVIKEFGGITESPNIARPIDIDDEVDVYLNQALTEE